MSGAGQRETTLRQQQHLSTQWRVVHFLPPKNIYLPIKMGERGTFITFNDNLLSEYSIAERSSYKNNLLENARAKVHPIFLHATFSYNFSALSFSKTLFWEEGSLRSMFE